MEWKERERESDDSSAHREKGRPTMSIHPPHTTRSGSSGEEVAVVIARSGGGKRWLGRSGSVGAEGKSSRRAQLHATR